MKITTIENLWDDRYEGYLETKIKTKEGFRGVSFGSDEPEDMNLVRNLSGAYDIKHMLILAYNAGKNGKELEIEELEEE